LRIVDLILSLADDRVAIFRQQATMITRKKETTAEKLNKLLEQMNNLNERCKEKQVGTIQAGTSVSKMNHFYLLDS
jgi:hypothetical protein